MVNSKKMSKSTVAIVLLSLLLVLSLILTATGAWFTAGDKANGTGGDTIKLRGDWLTITATAGEEATVTVKRTVNGTEETVANHEDAMPGDTIEIAGKLASFNIKNDKNYAFYYIIVKGTEVVDGEAKYVAAGSSADLSAIVAGAITPGTGVTEVTKNVKYTVKDTLEVANAGEVLLTVNATEAFGVYAIQAENMTAETALAQLKTLAGIGA